MYRWLNDASETFLKRGYLLPGQTVDQRVDIICNRAEEILGMPGFAKRFKENFQKGWYSLSSPIWSNFATDRGCPISCFSSFLADDMESILTTQAEVGIMTKYGGGTSGFFGELRPRGSKIRDNGVSHGPVHFMQMFDKLISVVSQGSVRRGSFAAYLPIDHPDILEFLHIKSEGSPIQDIFFGVCVPDYWMEEMIAGDQDKRMVWAKVLQSRAEKGLPYIFFTDNANNNTVDVYKDKGMKIHNSNLCTEIMLPVAEDESFVCDLSSMNILYYDEWKDTDAVHLLVYLLDAVMTEFIEKAKKIGYMNRAAKFAERHRALGVGWLGWHSYLQSNMISFESMQAKLINTQVAKTIHDKAYEASAVLAERLGEPEVLKGYGRRNTTLIAIAPTKSSSFILGQVSEGIEPIKSNYFVDDKAKIKVSRKNPYLVQLLKERGQDTLDNWNSILLHGGSVQHLDFLTDHEKDVFKTSSEISQKEVVIQAAGRQKYVDQGQSLNLMIHPDIPTKDVNALLIEGWQLGVKSFYYQHSVNAAQQFSRNIMSCSSCEG